MRSRRHLGTDLLFDECIGDLALNDTLRKFDGWKLASIDPDSRAIGLLTQT
jgi:hypothetical protein